jgi:hypothetical protein
LGGDVKGGFKKIEIRTRTRTRTDNTCASTGQIESNYDEITDSFDAMDLKPELLRGM